ncbi:MAG: hypothetical protein Q8936_13265 [Bacillota bacterium]|nr:hypothetical protein [Bacillota bacterium]
MVKNYTMYCDESIKTGKCFGNFYGGALIDNRYYDMIVKSLNRKKDELNLFGELKWAKMSAQYLDKYVEFIEHYFSFIRDNKIKVRIIFKHNYRELTGLTNEQLKNKFYILYYEFIKNAFGFQYCNNSSEDIFLRIYFDNLPNTKEQNENFKNYIFELQRLSEFKHNHIKIRREDITDVDSHKHVILQGMDIILGSIQYILNDEHMVIDPATGNRGKRTIAKEQLYGVIYNNVKKIYPSFNPGEPTDIKGDISNQWEQPYRHCEFIT